ncbi:MAG TPA: tail fiber protein [Thermoanaerobaculia bacterium]|nr:tail fiber protein [Thermoanaerobaculia bacterium]
MGTPFMGEIKIVGFNYPPKGWSTCNGQFLPINQNQALFSLLGTMYGGNGQTTFALPDFRGRVPIHVGGGFIQGQAGGQEFHTVTMSEMPAHNHFVQATAATQQTNNPTNNLLASINAPQYNPVTQLTTLHPSTITNTGGSQPHENRQPFTVLLFIIALQGVFPSRN